MKERCPVCGTAFDVGSFAASLLSVPEVTSLRVRCPVCFTDVTSDPVPSDPGPIADDDVLDPDDDAADMLRPGRDLSTSWGVDPDRFVAA